MYSPFFYPLNLRMPLQQLHITRRKYRSAICILLVLATLAACKQKAEGLFASLDPAQTGIHFENHTHKADLFNILYYLYYYNGGGVAAGDINNDGLTDLYFTANYRGGNKLYLNKGNFQFEDITEKAGVAGDADWSSGVTMADINGDGWLDMYVCTVSNQFGLIGHNLLFINNGKGGFTESAAAYGLDFSGLSTQAAFFDYDHDGDLDCYLLNHSKKPHANVVDTANRRRFDPIFGDRFYRCDITNGVVKYSDISAKAGIYQSSLGYGLGLAVADFNNDGWEDVYVGNDFHENDYYYINKGNGSFAEEGAQHFGHYSRFSMGNDAADFNNDGQTDMVTVDMLPPDEKTLKTYGSDESPNSYAVKLGMNGYQHQYSRNALQRNNGNGKSFSDIALMSGMHATDWSWCPLFADFDNDGKKDLFVSSGIVKRPVDMDYVNFVSSMQTQKGLETTDAYDAETIDKMPDGASHPFFFKGDGEYHMTDMSTTWGTATMKGYFNGAAYADFDNDGDLDVAINCLNAKAVILKNNNAKSNSININLKGEGYNTMGIGAKVYLFNGKKMQMQHLMPTRGFQSASSHIIHFGMDSSASADSLLVVWPDQRYQVLYHVQANKQLVLDSKQAMAGYIYENFFASKTNPFEEISLPQGIMWQHRENAFVDFNRQYLMPHAQSTRGPKMAVGDVNNDGLSDIYVCGATGQQGVMLLALAGGGYRTVAIPAMQANAACEEVDAIFFDANKDGKQDLYVVSGGNMLDDGQPGLADHLYLNKGNNLWEEVNGGVPPILTNKSCVAANDVDGDGDTDLFVGGLANAAKFGMPQNSYLLINDGAGKFSIAPKALMNAEALGIVTAAGFADMDGNGEDDLVVAGEWMPITIFYRTKNKFTKTSIDASSGLWQSLLLADLNGDGKKDIAAGNWGLNSKLATGKNGPLKLYVKDFDKNGTTEQVVCYTVNGKEYTFLAKDELERALPVLKKAYLTYAEVAGETVQYMFFDLFKEYYETKAATLESSVFVNKGSKQFDRKAMPYEAQLAPLFCITKDRAENKLIVGGNFYGTVPYEGRYDAQSVLLVDWQQLTALPMLTDGKEIRDIKWIKTSTDQMLLLATNNGALRLMRPTMADHK